MLVSQAIEDGDVITFNEEFTSKYKRIKVPLISAKEITIGGAAGGGAGAVGGDDEALPAAVEEERRHLVEAAIVRILKSRKRLSHNDLVAEATRQISSRFPPTPAVSHTMSCHVMSCDLFCHLCLACLIELSNVNLCLQFIKQRVESLIERDYLKRDEADRRIYVYIA